MTEQHDAKETNRRLVEEFRANDGVVGAPFAGWPLILVNHRGARSGRAYTTPLVHTRSDLSYVVIASDGGAQSDPQWFRNLLAHPETTVEIGADTVPVRARVALGDERDRLYRAQADLMPNFDVYAKATERQIPVVVLDPA